MISDSSTFRKVLLPLVLLLLGGTREAKHVSRERAARDKIRDKVQIRDALTPLASSLPLTGVLTGQSTDITTSDSE